jgi:hypothetical protein
MNRRLMVLLAGVGVGALVGTVLAQQSIGRHRQALFSAKPLRRLSALGYLSRSPTVEGVRLLHDYLAWERHPMLKRRGERVLRRMEAKLG